MFLLSCVGEDLAMLKLILNHVCIGDEQGVPSETPTSSASTVVEKPTKRKELPKLGSKPVLAAKPPPRIDEIRDAARGADLPSVSPMSSDDVPSTSLDSAAADLEITRSEENAEPVVSPSGMFILLMRHVLRKC